MVRRNPSILGVQIYVEHAKVVKLSQEPVRPNVVLVQVQVSRPFAKVHSWSNRFVEIVMETGALFEIHAQPAVEKG